jgi:hypothetical protein
MVFDPVDRPAALPLFWGGIQGTHEDHGRLAYLLKSKGVEVIRNVIAARLRDLLGRLQQTLCVL